MSENTAQENARTVLELNSEPVRMLHKGEHLDLHILSANTVRILRCGKLERGGYVDEMEKARNAHNIAVRKAFVKEM